MANTTNFNWATPDDTDLVKDGAAAIRTLGSSIDTSFVDLKGGTTGQVLSKASNTDLDYTWVTTDDANAIQNAIVDAKGDLIAASAADTPARLAVGNNGETLVADSSATTGLRWQGNYAAGKNAIINGDFRINQRAFSSTTTTGTYGFDRWSMIASDGTTTYSAQTFTAGTAPVAGYEGINFARLVSSGQTAAGAYSILQQKIEDVRTFAGQTVTVSFWAKASTGTPNIAVNLLQDFGSGGSTGVYNYPSSKKFAITASWARYTLTIPVASISGKTIGTGSSLTLYFWTSAGTTFNTQTDSMGIQSITVDFWGVQVEAGSVATAFQTATGTLQGELAACQRYYFSFVSGTNLNIGLGANVNTTTAAASISFPVTMRSAPSLSASSGTDYYRFERSVGTDDFNSFLIARATTTSATIYNNSEISGTTGVAGLIYTNNASASIAFTSEL